MDCIKKTNDIKKISENSEGLKDTILFNKLFNLVKENPNGFTANKNAELLNLKKGYAVSLTNNNSTDNSDSKKYYLDKTLIIDDLNTALKIAKENNQIAIFNFKTFETINLNTNELKGGLNN